MSDMSNRKVNHPPVIDAMVLVRFRDAFSVAERDSALEKLTESFPKRSDVLSEFSLHEGSDSECATQKASEKQVTITLSSADNERQVILQEDGVIYRDGREYKNKNTLLEHFSEVWSSCDLENKLSSMFTIRLRVVNRFSVSIQDIGRNIKFFPAFSLGNSKPLLGGAAIEVDIRSELRAANADVRIQYSYKSKDTMEVLFDIDTYIEDEQFLDFDSVEERLNRLSEFKNDIFYSNVIDADRRFENEPS